MGLFGKSKKEREELSFSQSPQLPELPKLPELPELPDWEYEKDDSESDESNKSTQTQVHKLPSFPSNYLGTKFSQNTIKEAVTGEQEGSGSFNEEDDFADTDDDREIRMSQIPLKRPLTEEMESRRFSSRLSGSGKANMNQGPVFVRIDKFEAAVEIFREIRKKIAEIELALEEIKRMRDKESLELQSWEKEVSLMKDQVEKVDRNLFSKL